MSTQIKKTYKIGQLEGLLYKDLAEICKENLIRVKGKKSNLINLILKKTSPVVNKKKVQAKKTKPTTKVTKKVPATKITKQTTTTTTVTKENKKTNNNTLPSNNTSVAKKEKSKPKVTTVATTAAANQNTRESNTPQTSTAATTITETTTNTSIATTSEASTTNVTERQIEKDGDPDNEVIALRMTRENCNSGELHASLIWNDIVDLDLHVVTPGGEHLYFGNTESRCGGWLDKDMNANQLSEEPIENIFWSSAPSGKYQIYVHYFRPHCNARFTNPNRSVPFRVRLIKNGKTEWFESTIAPYGKVDCFNFTIDGSSGASGAVGSFVILPPNNEPSTFQELCQKNKVSYRQGEGFYALKRKEDISQNKDMVLHNTISDTFIIGHHDVCTHLNQPTNQKISLKPQDIPANFRLFVQSTSHNRKIPADTHVLMRVSVKEALTFRQASKYNFK